MELFSYEGGQQWGRLPAGYMGERVLVSPAAPSSRYEAVEHVIDGQVLYEYRTKGRPLTAHNCLADFGAAMEAAATRFDVPVAVLFGTICIEATKYRDDRSHFDTRCIRFEPGYESDKETPHRVSPGLGQTLMSTGQEQNDREHLYLNLDGSVEELTRADYFIAERSIMLMAAYLRYQFDRKERDEVGFDDDDPVLAVSAYNAGSVRKTSKNVWHLLTYGEGRIDKFLAYHNDCLALLEARC